MKAIFEREIAEYFNTLVGYVFIASFMFFSGLLFTVNNIWTLSSDFNVTLYNCIYVFMLTSPILTMKLLAEERKTKRDQLLFTVDVSLSSIVLGKFLAAVCVFLITICCTAVYPIILFILGSVSFAMILNGYLGFILIGMVFISIGVFMSSMVENQLSAAVGTYAILFLLLCLDLFTMLINNSLVIEVLQWFSIFERFDPYQFGTFSLASGVYYLSITFIFLSISVVTMRYRRLG